MAKKRSRRRSSSFVAIPVQGSKAIGALADQAVITGDLMGGNFTEDFYAISADLSMVINGITAGEGDPSTALVAHRDYSDVEIAEALTVNLLGPGNKIEQEKARRLVRRVGKFQSITGLNTDVSLKMEGKGGAPNPRIKLGFVVQSGKTLGFGIQNRSGAVFTTGASVEVDGVIFGRWIL